MNKTEKPTLRFSKSGRFRILMVSDFHAGKSYDPKLKAGLEALLEECKPDLVVVGGDQCLDRQSRDAVRDYMADIMSPVIKRRLPWAAIIGNHDREVGIDVEEELYAYAGIDGCMNTEGPKDVSGNGNFYIPVMGRDGTPAYILWMIDDSLYQRDLVKKWNGTEKNKLLLPEKFACGSSDGTPQPDQVMWYYNESSVIEKKYGKKVPGAMFMHVSLPEFLEIVRNPEECEAVGSVREAPGCAEINGGMFYACLQRGDVKGIFFGHDHLIDLQGVYCGVIMAHDAALGYNMSAHDDLRGGRVIDIFENGDIETRAVKLWEIMGKKCMRDPEYMEGGCAYHIRKLWKD
ncbi:MAG: metallophosphoesterase [Clostridiales bacterium]|nr:metallophosphoesterase [Clostridiales bacterium]